MTEILQYLKKNIDENAEIKSWNAKRYLNLQLAGSYEYYQVTILMETFLLIKPLDNFTILKTKLHIDKIYEKTGYEVAVLLNEPTAYKIKKMLKERIAFLTMDKQMFLPFLALHIRQQRFNDMEVQKRDKFTPATQMVFLAILYSEKNEFDVEELTDSLNVSAMTILRAMEELKRIGVVKQEISGLTRRKKIYTPISRKEYYHIGKEYLINPVRKSCYVSYIPNSIKKYRAGLTALSEQTMLGEPEHEVYAVCVKQSVLSEYQVAKEQAIEEGMCEIQFMQYDVGSLTNNQYVDFVSLIMSLDKKDDRIEIAIDELMEEIEWYEE